MRTCSLAAEPAAKSMRLLSWPSRGREGCAISRGVFLHHLDLPLRPSITTSTLQNSHCVYCVVAAQAGQSSRNLSCSVCTCACQDLALKCEKSCLCPSMLGGACCSSVDRHDAHLGHRGVMNLPAADRGRRTLDASSTASLSASGCLGLRNGLLLHSSWWICKRMDITHSCRLKGADAQLAQGLHP